MIEILKDPMIKASLIILALALVLRYISYRAVRNGKED